MAADDRIANTIANLQRWQLREVLSGQRWAKGGRVATHAGKLSK